MRPELSKVSIEQETWETKREELCRSHMQDEKWMRLFCTLLEDHEFEKNRLIQLWIASGLIWGEYKYFIGDWYFEDLWSRAYILHSTTCYPNETKLYKVDVGRLMDGLEDMKDKELYLRLKDRHFEGSEHVQHLALVGDAIDEDSLSGVKKFKNLKTPIDEDSLNGVKKFKNLKTPIDEDSLNGLKKFKNLKTLILFPEDGPNINTVPDDIFGLKLLEVLDLSRTQIKELPDSIENLVDLRYLDLSFTLIELLPETIDCLSNLQTLKLNDCKRLLRLPEGTSKLTSLEHLEVDVINQLPFLPRGIGSLERLKSLSAFLVHKDEGRTITELKNMNHLSGRLCISGLENVLDHREAKEANLKKKDKLTELELRWDESRHSLGFLNENILELLCPSFQLEKLQISHCYRSKTPSWLRDPSFDKLTSIILFKCDFFGQSSLEGLSSLKYLSLINSNWVANVMVFPKLERLTVVDSQLTEYGFDFNFGWLRRSPNLLELYVERCFYLCRLLSVLSEVCVLNHLEVISCHDLESFLDQKLPTTLETLIIEDCPKINKWIQEHKDDWRKNIEHVKNVYIDQDEDRIYGSKNTKTIGARRPSIVIRRKVSH